jgi:ribonuclease-3
MTGGRDNPSNLSDALEAVFGAIYLDGGLGAVDAVISKLFSPYVELALRGQLHYDHKSLLYEWAQSDKGRDVEFKLLDMTGPEHDRQFTVGLFVEGKLINNGTGKTKKAAEQDASRRFFEDVRKD